MVLWRSAVARRGSGKQGLVLLSVHFPLSSVCNDLQPGTLTTREEVMDDDADLAAILAEADDDQANADEPTLDEILAEDDGDAFDIPTVVLSEDLADSPPVASFVTPTLPAKRKATDAEILADILAEPDDASELSDHKDLEEVLRSLDDELEEQDRAAEGANYQLVTPLLSRRLVRDDRPDIVKLEVLREITTQLSSTQTRHDVGLPACMSVHPRFIAVGTTHGLILVFDHYQLLKVILASHGSEASSTSSIDISPDGDWLVSGHKDGTVMLWDIAKGTVIKSIPDAHAKEPIVHVRFINKSNLLTVDITGVVNTIALNKVLLMFLAEAKCLLQGVGHVVALDIMPRSQLPTKAGAPPKLAPLTQANPLDNENFVVLATDKRVFIISLLPSANVRVRLPKPDTAGEEKLPYVAWRGSTVRTTDERRDVSDPMLAVCWDRQLMFMRLRRIQSADGSGSDIDCTLVSEMTIDTSACGVQWMSEEVVMVLTDHDQLCVIDVVSTSILDLVDIRQTRLVYHSKFLEKSFHQSLAVASSILYMLGFDQLCMARILSWTERIAVLREAGKPLDALALALDFYEGRAKAVVGLPRQLPALRAATSNRIAELLVEYMRDAMDRVPQSTGLPAGQLLPAAHKHYEQVGAVCVEYCVSISRTDLLFGDIFAKFCDIGQSGLFLELLEPFLLNDKLDVLDNGVLMAMVLHYCGKRQQKRVEQCLLHLDVRKMQPEQIVALCRKYQLPAALVYAYNGAGDFVTPLQDMLVALQRSRPEERAELGGRLLQYLSDVQAGKQFPKRKRDLPAEDLARIKRSVYSHLLQRTRETGPCVNLDLLMQFDTRQTLALLQSAFEDSNIPDEPPMQRQNVFDYLVSSVLFGDRTSLAATFSSEQQYDLYAFAAYFVARGTVRVSTEFLDRILQRLAVAAASEQSVGTQWQQTLLQLLQSPTMSESASKLDGVLALAERNKLYTVCDYIYRKKRDFRRVLESYLRDPERQRDIFAAIEGLVQDQTLSPHEQDVVRSATIGHLKDLIQIDSAATSRMILEQFVTDHARVIEELAPLPHMQFMYLRPIMEASIQKQQSVIAVEDTNDAAAQRRAEMRAEISQSQDMQELYVKLLCEYKRDRVAPFLMTHENYRLEPTLRLCQENEIRDAVAYLLERTGDFVGAMTLTLQDLVHKVVALEKAFAADPRSADDSQFSGDELPDMPALKDVQEVLGAGTALCQRNSQQLEVQESQLLWFRLLDTLADVHRKYQAQLASSAKQPVSVVRLERVLQRLLRTILSDMMGYLPLPSIIAKVVRDHRMDQFGEFRSIIMGMLDTYRYERSLLLSAKRLIENDTFRSARSLSSKRARAITPKTSVCGQCNYSLANPPEFVGAAAVVSVFNCGHGFHSGCMKSSDTCLLCNATAAAAQRPAGGRERSSTGASTATEVKSDKDQAAAQLRKYVERLQESERLMDRVPMSDLDRQVQLAVDSEVWQPIRAQGQLQLSAPIHEDPLEEIPFRRPGTIEPEPRSFNEVNLADQLPDGSLY
eukprot:TRINITY_DN6022_c0_g1_i1.p1 TRINITY_DN6022_c0_g1~~TRINITY_DN6022_c0_g1_i1.p1  ORF type:complete len:1522 (-),score=360.42 TRINITY_DN6022_c0_g1_i1:629-5194(-)